MASSEAVRSALKRGNIIAEMIVAEGAGYEGEAEGLKGLLTIAACDITFEHHRSILSLISQGNPASAMALMRVLHEARLRAYWFEFCATEEFLHQVHKGEESLPSAGNAAKELAQIFEGTTAMSKLTYHEKVRDQMNDLTHTGMDQLRSRFQEGSTIAPAFSNDTLYQAISEASKIAAVTALLFFKKLDRESTGTRVVDLYNKYFGVSDGIAAS